MSVNYVFVRNGKKYARPILSEHEYRELRDSVNNKKNLFLARQGNEWAKRRLVQMNYSGYFPYGAVAGSKFPSKAFGFDIDDKLSFERVAKILLSSPEKYGLLMLERSVSQGGHAVFEREEGKTILENQVRIANMLHCEMDCRTHDINRVYFTTANDDLLFLSADLFKDTYMNDVVEKEIATLLQREKNNEEVLPQGAHGNNKHFKPWE